VVVKSLDWFTTIDVTDAGSEEHVMVGIGQDYRGVEPGSATVLAGCWHSAMSSSTSTWRWSPATLDVTIQM
jgi:hypothetical protein